MRPFDADADAITASAIFGCFFPRGRDDAKRGHTGAPLGTRGRGCTPFGRGSSPRACRWSHKPLITCRTAPNPPIYDPAPAPE